MLSTLTTFMKILQMTAYQDRFRHDSASVMLTYIQIITSSLFGLLMCLFSQPYPILEASLIDHVTMIDSNVA